MAESDGVGDGGAGDAVGVVENDGLAAGVRLGDGVTAGVRVGVGVGNAVPEGVTELLGNDVEPAGHDAPVEHANNALVMRVLFMNQVLNASLQDGIHEMPRACAQLLLVVRPRIWHSLRGGIKVK